MEDFFDEEIMKIENFFCFENRSGLVGWDIVIRDYLIWWIVIEFGLWIGEILVFWVEDCLICSIFYFWVMCIEERDLNYFDFCCDFFCLKIFFRDLGIFLDNLWFFNLVNEYVFINWYVLVIYKGKKKKCFNLLYRFLIIVWSGNFLF